MVIMFALAAAVLYGSADFLGGAASRHSRALSVAALSVPAAQDASNRAKGPRTSTAERQDQALAATGITPQGAESNRSIMTGVYASPSVRVNVAR